jgi:hypothetical protein
VVCLLFSTVAWIVAAGTTYVAAGDRSHEAGPHREGLHRGRSARVPNGEPCAGQELTLKVNGTEAPAVTVPYGPITLHGVLHCGTVPIRDAQILLATSGAANVTSNLWVQSGLDGSFSCVLPAGSDRTITASYVSYSDDPRPSVTTSVALSVSAPIELEIEPRRVHNGRWTKWSGRLLGGPFPSPGVSVLPEVKDGRRWMPFDQVIATGKGDSASFAYRYRFGRTTETTTYTFRAALPATGAGGYPYSFGASNEVRVRVIGARAIGETK